jgi:hypothetical protein
MARNRLSSTNPDHFLVPHVRLKQHSGTKCNGTERKAHIHVHRSQLSASQNWASTRPLIGICADLRCIDRYSGAWRKFWAPKSFRFASTLFLTPVDIQLSTAVVTSEEPDTILVARALRMTP